MELHFALGRVNVDIHGGGVDFQKQAAHWIPSLHERGVIALNERVINPPIFDGPAIDEDKLSIAGGARNSRRPDQSPHP